MTDKRETLIPFSGFYGTYHDQAMDEGIRQTIFADQFGHVTEELQTLFEDCLDNLEWGTLLEAYAQKYVETMSDLIGIELTYETMASPRYYNHGTDRIFATVAKKDVHKMFEAVKGEELVTVCKRIFTSYDGFISFYDPDYTNWPENLDDWDHNQVGAILAAYWNKAVDQSALRYYMWDFCHTEFIDKVREQDCEAIAKADRIIEKRDVDMPE